MSTLPFKEVAGEPLNTEQTSYLEGLFAGMENRGLRFGDVEAAPVGGVDEDDLTVEERIKNALHPLDAHHLLLEHARENKPPEKENVFRFKWNGLFFLSPNKEAFMARLRIPGGQLRSFQLHEIAKVAHDLTTGYVQITTRANFQIRTIGPKDAPAVVRRIQSVGLHTRGAGADNIRNLTASPTAGIDPHELIDVSPYCHELANHILQTREFYNLPRKFNIAFDGGGQVSVAEDTNDIGVRAVKLAKPIGDLAAGIHFRVALGGATGLKSFANDLGVLVSPAQLTEVLCAIIRVYIANGDRTNRKRARLKYVLEKMPLAEYLTETETLLGYSLTRAPQNAGTGLSEFEKAHELPNTPHPQVGVFPQKQDGLSYVGVALPVGQITPEQMLRIADLADEFGNGEVRLTIWQNFLLPNIRNEALETVKARLEEIGLDWQQSNLRSGVIACTGNAYCKFAMGDTKGHAQEIADYLDARLTLDRPINIHLTGCPHSCAQHYMGDLGLLATTVKTGDGTEPVEAYHVFVGGGFGKTRALGRQIAKSLPLQKLKPHLENLLRTFQNQKQNGETFQQFTLRHDETELAEMFAVPEATVV
jgi:ferredoxin-nitrite reductase